MAQSTDSSMVTVIKTDAWEPILEAVDFGHQISFQGAEDVVQLAHCLPSMQETLSLIPSIM